MFVLAVVLGAGHDPARRETWFTVGRLKREMALFGLASGRQVDHLVARLCSVGFLAAQRAPEDRRVRILQPTEAMLAHDRDWLAAHHVGLAHLCPENDYGLALNGDPDFQLAHRRIAPAFLPLSAKALTAVPETLFFLDRAAGPLVLAALLQAALAEPDGVHAAVPYADVGARFGVSRTHVRELLVAAAARGLMRLHGRGGHRVEILPALWSGYDRSIATGMYLLDMIYAVLTNRRPDTGRRPIAAD
ncbi:MAG: hypothetical protein WDO24_16965 [Pseudomonadota bacterium]